MNIEIIVQVRIFTEKQSVGVNIFALFTNTEVNNCFSIDHNETKIPKNNEDIFETICISARVKCFYIYC